MYVESKAIRVLNLFIQKKSLFKLLKFSVFGMYKKDKGKRARQTKNGGLLERSREVVRDKWLRTTYQYREIAFGPSSNESNRENGIP